MTAERASYKTSGYPYPSMVVSRKSALGAERGHLHGTVGAFCYLRAPQAKSGFSKERSAIAEFFQ